MSILMNRLTIAVTALLCVFGLMSAVNISVFFVCAVCLIYSVVIIVMNNGRIINDKMFRLWLILFGVLVITIFLTRSRFSNYNLMLFSLIMVGGAIVSIYKSINIDTIFRVIVVISCISICVWLLKTIFPSFRKGDEFDGTNGVSVSSAILLFYSLWILDKSRRYYRIVFLLVAVIGIVVASERSNFVLIPFPALVVYFLFNKKNKFLKFMEIMVCLLSILVLFWGLRRFLYTYPAFARLYDTYDLYMAGDTVSAGRNRMNIAAIKLWKQNPLWGNGWFYFYYNNKNILENGQYVHVHNYILELLCDCGIIGTLVALTPFIVAVINNIAILKSGCDYSGVFKYTLCMQVFFLTDSFFHVSLYSSNVIVMYFFTIIIMCACVRQNIMFRILKNNI